MQFNKPFPPQQVEKPRILEQSFQCNKPAVFTIAATGRFWFDRGLDGVNKSR